MHSIEAVPPTVEQIWGEIFCFKGSTLICLDTVTFRVQSQKRSPSVKPSGHGILQIFGEFIIIEMFKQFIIYLI